MASDQESFWNGQFGSDYVERNRSQKLLASRVALFARVLRQLKPIDTVLEIGSNIGLNLTALSTLFPDQNRTGIEINPAAHSDLAKNPHCSRALLGSVQDVAIQERFDLVLSKGVLIHLDPNSLSQVYEKIQKWTRRYFLCIEYYSPTPVEIEYRGHSEKLYKRDFAGEFLDSVEGFSLIDYGFVYHRDSMHPQDDNSWFLLERQSSF